MDVVVVWDMPRPVNELGVNPQIAGDTGAGNGASKVRKLKTEAQNTMRGQEKTVGRRK